MCHTGNGLASFPWLVHLQQLLNLTNFKYIWHKNGGLEGKEFFPVLQNQHSASEENSAQGKGKEGLIPGCFGSLSSQEAAGFPASQPVSTCTATDLLQNTVFLAWLDSKPWALPTLRNGLRILLAGEGLSTGIRCIRDARGSWGEMEEVY